MKHLFSILVLCLTATFVFSQRLNTPTLSPFSKISQEVGLTEVTLQYARPSAKGRTIFGALVPYDKIWRTGANASTKITLNEPAEIGGNPIDSGTYALYTIPGEMSWTIVIHSNTRLRSLAGDGYKQENDVFRFEVKPMASVDYVETFTIQFANLRTNGCDIQLSWESTVVNIPISVDVDSKIAAQMTEFLKEPDNIPHRTYFEAAQYYLHNHKDLNDALSWIDAALAKSEKNFRYGLLKSKIQHKSGDASGALMTISAAHDWAQEAGNANYIEQTELFKKELSKEK